MRDGSEIVGGVGGHQGIVELPGQFEHFAECPGGLFQAALLEGDGAQQIHRAHAAIGVSPGAEPLEGGFSQCHTLGEFAEPGRGGRREQFSLGTMADCRIPRGLMLLQGFAETSRFHQLAKLAGRIGGFGRAWHQWSWLRFISTRWRTG